MGRHETNLNDAAQYRERAAACEQRAREGDDLWHRIAAACSDLAVGVERIEGGVE
jgi:hypothetical protein